MSSTALAPVIVVVVVFVAVTLFQFKLSKGFDYECGNCGHRFSPSPLAAALAPHRPHALGSSLQSSDHEQFQTASSLSRRAEKARYLRDNAGLRTFGRYGTRQKRARRDER